MHRYTDMSSLYIILLIPHSEGERNTTSSDKTSNRLQALEVIRNVKMTLWNDTLEGFGTLKSKNVKKMIHYFCVLPIDVLKNWRYSSSTDTRRGSPPRNETALRLRRNVVCGVGDSEVATSACTRSDDFTSPLLMVESLLRIVRARNIVHCLLVYRDIGFGQKRWQKRG